MSQNSSDSRITISKAQLTEAGNAAGLLPGQTEIVWNTLSAQQPAPEPSSKADFGGAQVAWYVGAAVVVSAMTWLMAVIGDLYGSGAVLATSLAYAAGFAFAGSRLVSQEAMRVPGGLLYVLATIMTPVAVGAGIEVWHWQPGIAQGTLIAACATVAVGLLFTFATRIPFVSLPALVAGFVAVLSGSDLAFGFAGDAYWPMVATAYGALLACGSFMIDRRDAAQDYSFWGYIVGCIAAFIGLTAMDKGEGLYFAYCLIGVGALLWSVVLGRGIFAFTGTAMILTHIGHISFTLFQNSLAAAVFVTLIGLATIYVGVLYQRHRASVDGAVLRMFPQGVTRRFQR